MYIFSFSKSKGFFFFFPNQKGLFWKMKTNYFWERKKITLDCLEKKTNGYSLVV